MNKVLIALIMFATACNNPASHTLTDKEWNEISVRRKHQHGFAKYIYSGDTAVIGYVLSDSTDYRGKRGDTLMLPVPITIIPCIEHITIKP